MGTCILSFAKANWIWQGLDRGQLYDSDQIHCLPGRNVNVNVNTTSWSKSSWFKVAYPASWCVIDRSLKSSPESPENQIIYLGCTITCSYTYDFTKPKGCFATSPSPRKSEPASIKWTINTREIRFTSYIWGDQMEGVFVQINHSEKMVYRQAIGKDC